MIGFSASQEKDTIEISDTDIELLYAGLERMLENPRLSIAELNVLLAWINKPDFPLMQDELAKEIVTRKWFGGFFSDLKKK